ncbi:proline-rich transmembrane protein 1-like [Mytilus californianus]|uniref:proline-rich transmembrane protein 1-like n=1 Tax=Mytilus californianus TaxID=6549 RepID=UPI00224748FB|nr:proline-rich transmembrane protein 1-like [Mytilus californianus]
MSEKNQDEIYPSAPPAYNQGQHSENCPAQSPPSYYVSNEQQGQQYGQYSQGYSQRHGYEQPPAPQGYSHAAGYQPVPQTQHYGKQPMYGGQGQGVVVAQPVPSTMIVTTAQPRPSNWIIPAVLACICCFWPTGICAIVAASNSNSAADRGNMQSAEQSARTARNLTILTVVLGVICVVIIIVLKRREYSPSTYLYHK